MAAEWEKYYTKEQLQVLQEIERNNLKVFIEACEKLGIEYFVYGGTLLGVEKYQGMIPWDDDIDVALPRDSYEKFIKEANNILPPGYLVQSPQNCRRLPYPYAKLRRLGTRYVEYIHRNINIESGIYIDIYPVDKISDDEDLRLKQFKAVRRWMFIYDCRQSRFYDTKEIGIKGALRNVAKWIICNGLKVFPQEYCMRKINKYMTMYNGTGAKRYAAMNSPNYNNIYLDLFPLQDGMFDGIKVKLPGDYKTHLRMRYGDYSDVPPEGERVGHIPYILDFGEITKQESR